MDNKPILYGIVGLVLGVAITIFAASNAVNNNNTGMMEKLDESPMEHMEEMMEPLEGKTGEPFDREFLSLMIVHHQGAIDMANEAKVNASHDEIKKLSDDIISAQTKEIEMMQGWQTQWKYK